MRQTSKKKQKDKVAAILMLCFCLIALTSIFTIKASIEKISQNAKDLPVTNKTTVKDEDKSEKSSKKAEEATIKAPVVDSQNKAPDSGVFSLPITTNKAEISKKYSMDMVIYNVTLDQYMTHPGMDIKASEGTLVRAVAAGTVSDVSDDDAYGRTILITHSNGYSSKYCNLSEKGICVEKGDTVKNGQVIGAVGKTALYESMEPAHLHLEMIKNSKPINPASFIKY